MSAATDFAVERLARPTSSTEDGHTIAVVDGERSVTFDELDLAADQVANGLRQWGLGSGDRVAYELIRFARDRLAGFKCPTSVDFVDVLPRNTTGKVLRRELREPYWAGRERRID